IRDSAVVTVDELDPTSIRQGLDVLRCQREYVRIALDRSLRIGSRVVETFRVALTCGLGDVAADLLSGIAATGGASDEHATQAREAEAPADDQRGPAEAATRRSRDQLGLAFVDGTTHPSEPGFVVVFQRLVVDTVEIAGVVLPFEIAHRTLKEVALLLERGQR